tara:strand:+ start:251 stop:439 length:189 start_codon:yes stop_codon:yes gene_type:complete
MTYEPRREEPKSASSTKLFKTLDSKVSEKTLKTCKNFIENIKMNFSKGLLNSEKELIEALKE